MTKNALVIMLSIYSTVCFYGCKTSQLDDFGQEKSFDTKVSQEDEIKILKAKVLKAEEKIQEFNKDTILFKFNLQTLNERILTLQKDLEIINRGVRSGIYENLSSKMNMDKMLIEQKEKLPNAPFATGSINTQVGVASSSSGEEISSSPFQLNNKKTELELLADAEIKTQRKEFKQALESINILRKNYPNSVYKDREFVIAADSWFGLKEYQHTLSVVRDFYLSFPSGHQKTIKMQFMEALCYEAMGLKEKAATLFSEIIHKEPNSSYAKTSRKNLERLKNS
ncbi:MAG: outer membrane protein assembly factor BamD [Silvanigrellaceae bacterium]|nr:outer membrane protein assembly factor BamD [Silvanigrellaceae bacterium]